MPRDITLFRIPAMSEPTLNAAAIAALAAAAELPLDDEAMAARIAAGASAAIAAVRAQHGQLLFEFEPADYLATLERLAG
jgi:Pyruvate/2-oxoacid:ferredoxin oxidoreductase gamma subunit